MEITSTAAAKPKTVSTDDLERLLERGIVEHRLIGATLAKGSPKYLIDRAVTSAIVDSLRADGATVVIHSDAGNGRTLLAQQVAQAALNERYRVFSLEATNESYSYDIEFFSQANRQIHSVDRRLRHE